MRTDINLKQGCQTYRLQAGSRPQSCAIWPAVLIEEWKILGCCLPSKSGVNPLGDVCWQWGVSDNFINPGRSVIPLASPPFTQLPPLLTTTVRSRCGPQGVLWSGSSQMGLGESGTHDLKKEIKLPVSTMKGCIEFFPLPQIQTPQSCMGS